ncbi:alpha/beta fold hydrolase [Kaarinaea lacus]
MRKLNILLTIVAAGLMFTTETTFADKWIPKVKTVRVNGYDMAYVERGEGAPLILVHGALSDYRTWLPLMPELSETNRTIAVSLRHHYPENWQGEGDDLTLQQHTNDLAEFIKSLNLGPVNLLGHARGAVITMMIANKYPELVSHLVLAEPAPMKTMLQDNPRMKKQLAEREAMMKKATERYQQGDPEGGLKMIVEYIAGPGSWDATSDSRRKTLRENTWTQLSNVIDFETPFHCNNISKIKSPVLLVGGERSQEIYGQMNSAVKSCVKKATTAMIGDAGHFMYSNNPTAFVFEVQEFVAPQ